MFVCDNCGEDSDVKISCPNCGAAFCSNCIKAINDGGNKCPKCDMTSEAVLRRDADTRTRGNPI